MQRRTCFKSMLTAALGICLKPATVSGQTSYLTRVKVTSIVSVDRFDSLLKGYLFRMVFKAEDGSIIRESASKADLAHWMAPNDWSDLVMQDLIFDPKGTLEVYAAIDGNNTLSAKCRPLSIQDGLIYFVVKPIIIEIPKLVTEDQQDGTIIEKRFSDETLGGITVTPLIENAQTSS